MFSITEQDIFLLRSLISVDLEGIETAFAEKISPKAFKTEKLIDLRAFLEDKIQTSSEKYTQRIQKLIELLNSKIMDLSHSDAIIEQLCVEIFDLSEEKNRIEDEILEKKNRLRKLLPKGKTQIGRFQAYYRPGAPYLGVVRASLIPQEFLRAQPDRKKLLQWFETSGEAIPGTEIRQRKDTIIVKKVKT